MSALSTNVHLYIHSVSVLSFSFSLFSALPTPYTWRFPFFPCNANFIMTLLLDHSPTCETVRSLANHLFTGTMK